MHSDGYGTLVLTEASASVLDGSRRVSLRREPERQARASKKSAIAATVPLEAAPLFEKLREWRAGEAREQAVPAYIIFGDATLRGIALTKPQTLAELGAVSGVGEKKLEAYGEALLDLVAAQ